MKTNILITGANGFIGSNLMKCIKEQESNLRVTTLNREYYLSANSQKLSKILANQDVVIHLGGKTRGDAIEMIETNLLGTMRILKEISLLSGKKPLFIYPSTIGVYKPSKKIEESSEVGLHNFYTLSKRITEKAIETYVTEFGLSAIILRISNVYGPGMPPFSHSVIANFLELAKHNQEFMIEGTGNQQRDFLYIDDVSQSILNALKLKLKPKESQTIDVFSADGISVKKLAQLIGKITNTRIKIKYNNIHKKQGSWVGKNYAKAKKTLTWHPIMTLEKGIQKLHEEK